jgi:flavin reductase (DIM6/NTAB) family NADH-FMN oxidoreductase RutF
MMDVGKVLKKLEYGIYVITLGEGESGNAFTASWVSQVSSDPPMVTLAVNNKHQSSRLIKESGSFAVNLIEEGQDAVVKAYYGPAESGYEKLRGVRLDKTPRTSTPLIQGAVGYLDCKVVETFTVGNHTLFVAEVVAAQLHDESMQLMTSTNSSLRYTG